MIKSAGILLSCCLLFFSFALNAQPNYGPTRNLSSGEILEGVRKLQVTGRVLYIAAHPDDENTRLLAWLARDQKVEAAYLSLTRGDGGQNLIGKEVRECLGVIRTQELLAARRVDGARQYFTRANDFGYSKTPEETFTKWQRDSLLADVVWVIRQFQPDVIITRFNPEPAPTHGHHTASAQLAVDAFAAAADPKRFPEQLQFVQPWTTTSLFWNTSWWFFGREDFDKTGYLAVSVGSFNSVLGTGYGEIAAESRSMHKSQGFGAARQRGEEIEYLKPLAGKAGLKSLFEGVVTDWSKVKNSTTFLAALQKAEAAFDASQPENMLPHLLEAHRLLVAMDKNNIHVQEKRLQLEKLIAETAGIWQEATAEKFTYTTGDSLGVKLQSLVRRPVQVSRSNVSWESVRWEGDVLWPFHYESDAQDNKVTALERNKKLVDERRLMVAKDVPFSSPFWLNQRLDAGFFDLPKQQWVGVAENPAAYSVKVSYRVTAGGKSAEILVTEPVLYRWTDPVDGERYRPVEVLPPVTLAFDRSHYFSREYKAVSIEVVVQKQQLNLQGTLSLDLPEGWLSLPEKVELSGTNNGSEQRYRFEVRPGKNASSGQISAVLRTSSSSFDRSLSRIEYKHLPVQTLLLKATAPLHLIELKTSPRRIAYIDGAGDDLPVSLRQLGYVVDVVDVSELSPELLKRYDVILTGIRAYNTVAALAVKNQLLFDFVHAGGTLIQQYNTAQGLVTDQLGPINLKLSRERTTVEESPVGLLQPEHPLLNQPNRIQTADFDNWVQERGLYYPGTWDKKMTPLLRMADPGEKNSDGALLYGEFGQGVYIYTGLSFFREIPAGVPGAYRLLVNLIEARQPKQTKKP